jgi:ribonuclease HI
MRHACKQTLPWKEPPNARLKLTPPVSRGSLHICEGSLSAAQLSRTHVRPHTQVLLDSPMVGFVDHVKLFSDGGSRGNPGPGAIAILLLTEGDVELASHRECIGHTTNNKAEYHALLKGLELCASYTRTRVSCYSDSQLIVNQLNGTWRVRQDDLRELFSKVRQREHVFDGVSYTHVRRSNPFIARVDQALNDALDRG